MEANTFATTVFARTPAARAFDYLRRLQNLDEWTLGSRMIARIDDDTWMGTASGYQTMLCYHVRTLPHARVPAIEWQCGYTYRAYFKQYPVLVFPSRYVDPSDDDGTCHVHWISVVDPRRRTDMIMQGIAAVHHYEARALKAALERAEGLQAPAPSGRWSLIADTMWVDASIALARELLADAGALSQWAPQFRATDAAAGRYLDEYRRSVCTRFEASDLGDYVLVEQDYAYAGAVGAPAEPTASTQRCPILLIPSTRAFGDDAPGFLLHRIAFVRADGAQTHGRTSVADLTAESMAIKRILEARAGNTASFARGMSYRPDANQGPATEVPAASPSISATTPHAVTSAPPDIFSTDFIADPYPHYRRMRDEFPLYFHPPTRAWILSRYDDVRLALNHPAFTTRSYERQTEPLLGRTLVQLEGREHSLQRSLLSPTFSARSIRDDFADAITQAVDELIEAFASRGEADLINELVAHLPVRIMASMLGLPIDDRERFRAWYTALIRAALNLTGDPDVARAGTTARDELDAYLRPLIAERRAAPAQDLISTLATTTVEGDRLSDEQIVRFAMLMVFAGGETTEKGLATTLRNLLAHPETLDAVRDDRSLVPRAIAESFRHTAPTHMVPRQTCDEVAVSGGILPAGAEVLCFLASANRDERRFDDPDRFDLHRPDADPARAFAGQAPHLAFGGGRHFCLGAVLSRFEIEIALNRVFDALPELRLAAETAPPPDVGLFLRGPATLPVQFSPVTTAARS